MWKILIGCIASFLFFGWLPIAVGTYEIVDAVIGGILGIVIALIGFAIYEIKALREEIGALRKKLKDNEADIDENK
ncbi:MAG: hypothetical protein IJ491_01930 [Clostridia bacterium]|nr:hypothetical protein [Clostridia bacterium]